MREKYLRFENSRGDMFQFGDYYREIQMDGLARLETEVHSRPRGRGHGVLQTGVRVRERNIHILAASPIGNDGYNRQLVHQFFKNPAEEYKITVDYKGEQKWNTGTIEIIDLPMEHIHTPQALELEITCPDPFFKSVDEFGQDIAHITPMYGWPAYYPTEFPVEGIPEGAIYSYYDFEREVRLVNDGYAETYMRLEVIAEDVVRNLKVSNERGEYIKINDTMEKGDQYLIDFEHETISKNGENINRKLDKRSHYFPIPLGATKIKYDADEGEHKMMLKVNYWRLLL